MSNEQRNVDWNMASIMPGSHELNNSDNVKNGSEKRINAHLIMKQDVILRRVDCRKVDIHCQTWPATATGNSSISARLTNHNMDNVVMSAETNTAIKNENLTIYSSNATIWILNGVTLTVTMNANSRNMNLNHISI